MGNYSVYSNDVLTDLSKRFQNLNFKFSIKDIGVKVSVFTVLGKSLDIKQEDKWRIISEEIALKFQSKMDCKEDKWNLYIIYVCKDKVGKELKAKIENDKFSSRKIVEANFTKELTNETINNLITKYITNTDLIDVVNKTRESVKKQYEPKRKSIWDLIPKDKSLKGKTELQSEIIKKLKLIKYED